MNAALHLPVLQSQSRDGRGRHATTDPVEIHRVTVNLHRASKKALAAQTAILDADDPHALAARPQTRAECADLGAPGAPCPWVSCRWHLALEVHEDTGSIGIRHAVGEGLEADVAWDAIAEAGLATCALAMLEEHPEGLTLEEVGDHVGVTRERIRQIEAKALAKLPKHTKHLRDVLVEDPAPVLRPTRCGPVPAAERRVWTDPPPRYAHLPGPAAVADGETEFWCGHMGTALRGSLCAKRHLARTRVHAGFAAKTYPECAKCVDGEGVAARVGGAEDAAPQRDDAPAVPARSIDWMGDGPESAGDAPSEELPPVMPEALPTAAEEPAVKVTKAKARSAKGVSLANAGRVTAPAAEARCPAYGCEDPPQGYRESLDPLLRPLCKRHRLLAQGERTKRVCSTEEAVGIILRRAAAADAQELDELRAELARIRADLAATKEQLDAAVADRDDALLETSELREQAKADAAEIERLRAGAASLRDESDESFVALRELRPKLVRAEERIAELEGQQLADVVHRCPAPRDEIDHIERVWLAASRWDEGIEVSVRRARDGGWEAALFELPGDPEAPDLAATAPTPREAVEALRSAIDERARTKAAEILAALEGGP